MRIVLDKPSELNNFNNNTNKGPWLIWFYADWCGHCTDMKPEWDLLEKRCKNNKKLNVAKVKDTLKENISPNMSNNVMGFPTIRFFNNGKLQDEYSGNRNNNAFLEFLLNKIGNLRNNSIKKSVKKINRNIRKSFKRKSLKKNSKKGKKKRKSNRGRKVARAAGGFIRDKSVQQFKIGNR